MVIQAMGAAINMDEALLVCSPACRLPWPQELGTPALGRTVRTLQFLETSPWNINPKRYFIKCLLVTRTYKENEKK